MPDRDPNGPITVINRFEVKGDITTFERELRRHHAFLRQRPGFDFLVTVRLADRPRTYVLFGHWSRLSGFLDTAHDDAFVAQVQRLGPLVDTEADQARSVERTLRADAAVGDTAVVLLTCRVRDHSAFEKAYAALGEVCARLGGFGGSDLLRSMVRPLSYTGVQWWRDAGHCERALASGAYRAALAELSAHATVTAERSHHLAYERVVG
ncbi:putative quinol monooxygenase [Streptomyces sp. NPDC015131]|uniref:putative quinol monooxygenase n=1 Tax=Streptomyces sp. NPDC015131 TaxID=3364941 RepID=UPI0036FDF94A